MRFIRGWRRGAAAIALLIAVLALASSAAAADEPTPSVEIAAVAATPEQLAKPLEVQLKPPAGEEAGVLQLPLVAREAGQLEVQFLDSKTGKEVAIEPAAKADEKKLVISGEVPKELTVGQLHMLRLVFTPPKAEPEALAGILKVGIRGGLPITRTVTVAAAKKGWAPAQKKVEIASTRIWPFSPAPEVSRSIGVTPEDPSQPLSKEALASRYVAFSSWGNATVTVGRPYPAGKKQRAKIAVSGVSGVGTASTVVDLGGAAKPSQEVEVVVQVGDAIWFPLFIVLLGAILGRYLPAWYDRWRGGRVLGAEMQAAKEAYEKARDHPPDPRDDPPPDSPLPPDHLKPIEAEDLAAITALADQLESRFRLPGDLEDQAKKAKAAIDRLEAWVAMRSALRELAKAVAEAGPKLAAADEETKLPLLDSEGLLQAEIEVSDLAQSERWAKQVAVQAEVLELYAATCEATEAARRRGDLDAEGAKEQLLKALDAYEEAGPVLARSPRRTELLIAALHELHGRQQQRQLFGVTLALERGPSATPALSLGSIGEALSQVVGRFAVKGGRSPQEVQAEVRKADRVVFFLAVLVSSLAYLLPVYSGGPFGTPIQYLGALIAGLAGQVLVTVAVPFTRSMSSSDEKEDDSPAATPTVAAT